MARAEFFVLGATRAGSVHVTFLPRRVLRRCARAAGLALVVQPVGRLARPKLAQGGAA